MQKIGCKILYLHFRKKTKTKKTMETVLEILKYILPAIIVLIATVLVLSKILERDEARRKHELFMNNQKLITPIRLQSYERMVLFLERIAPDALIMRNMSNKLSAKQLHSQLLQSIRAEYEHNLSQQVYISSEAWKIIKGAKESVIKLINSIASELPDDAKSLNLSTKILETVVEENIAPTIAATEFLKNEIRTLYK